MSEVPLYRTSCGGTRSPARDSAFRRASLTPTPPPPPPLDRWVFSDRQELGVVGPPSFGLIFLDRQAAIGTAFGLASVGSNGETPGYESVALHTPIQWTVLGVCDSEKRE